MTLYLSRVQLADTPATRALKALIDPIPAHCREALRLHDPEKGRIMDAHHRLVWALFADDWNRPPDGGADGGQRRSEFLWRAEGKGRFLILSARPPAADGADLFAPPQVKEFAPDLAAGDRLAFLMRVNATKTRKTGKLRKSGKPHTVHIDVVMDRLYPITGQNRLSAEQISERPALRHGFAVEAAAEWLRGQGERNGFAVEQRPDEDGAMIPDIHVADYSVVPLPAHTGPRRGQPQFGVMDLTGHIRVTDPVALLDRLGRGFGHAKAFGCGLMLVRRAGQGG